MVALMLSALIQGNSVFGAVWYLKRFSIVQQAQTWRRNGGGMMDQVIIQMPQGKSPQEDRMRTIGKCVYCKDPIYGFQEFKVEDSVIPVHKGCLVNKLTIV